MAKPNVFFFDVEATSLHGIGFAAAAIVAEKASGRIINRFALWTPVALVSVNDWVKENVIPNLQSITSVPDYRRLRDAFFKFYMVYSNSCDVWSDVNFPVETNFLTAVVGDDRVAREWAMPYPLYDLATIMSVDIDRFVDAGMPLLNKHNPEHDVLASTACLFKRMNYEKLQD